MLIAEGEMRKLKIRIEKIKIAYLRIGKTFKGVPYHELLTTIRIG